MPGCVEITAPNFLMSQANADAIEEQGTMCVTRAAFSQLMAPYRRQQEEPEFIDKCGLQNAPPLPFAGCADTPDMASFN